MDIPTPPAAFAALATFVRDRLAEVQESLTPLWSSTSRSLERAAPATDSVRSTARQVAMVIVSAAAPFAPNSYARTRLLRQMHASGSLEAGTDSLSGECRRPPLEHGRRSRHS